MTDRKGAFLHRDRSWHPPGLTPGYKTSVARSPQKALISMNTTLSEQTGPVFGHGVLGDLDNDLILNYAASGEMVSGSLFTGVCWTRTARAYPAFCWNFGRPMRAGVIATRKRDILRRWTRTLAVAVAR